MKNLLLQRLSLIATISLLVLSSSYSMETQCSDGIDNDDDGLVDCLDMDCAQTVDCCSEIDTDGDGIGDFCDKDDDNDGITDEKECPAESLTVDSEDIWVSIAGANPNDIKVGDVFIVEDHFMNSTNSLDLRFELLGKFENGVSTDRFIVDFSNSNGVQINDPKPSDRTYITYSLSWVNANSVTDSDKEGVLTTPFTYADLTIIDLDNEASAGTNSDANFSDVAAFLHDDRETFRIKAFRPGSEVSQYDLGGNQIAYGLTDLVTVRGVSSTNPCDGCEITAHIPSFQGARLVHGVFGDAPQTSNGTKRRQAQWRFLVGNCRDSDGDGKTDIVDKDSDDDGCVDAIEGSLEVMSSMVTSNGCLAENGTQVNEDGIPTVLMTTFNEECQDIGTSIDPNETDPFCCSPSTQDTTVALCSGESVTIFGTTFNSTTSMFFENEGECGINLNVIVSLKEPETLTAINRSICDGQSVEVNGQTYTEAGTFTQEVVGSNGCNTTQTIVITIDQAEELEPISRTICAGSSTEVNGVTYDSEGTFTQDVTGSNGCPTTQQVNISVSDREELETINRTICDGESVEVNGTTYNQAGTFTQETTGSNGCPTTQTIVVSLADAEELETISRVICEGQSTTVNGVTYDAAGTYTQNSTGSNGCPTTQTVVIEVKNLPVIDTTVNLCTGDMREIYGLTVDGPGSFVQILPDADGCDTTVNITVMMRDCSRTCCDRMGNHKIRVSKKSGSTNRVIIKWNVNANVVLYDGEVSDANIYRAFKAFSLVENNYEQSNTRKREIIETILKGGKIDKNSDLLTNSDTHTEMLELLEYSYYNLNVGETFEL